MHPSLLHSARVPVQVCLTRVFMYLNQEDVQSLILKLRSEVDP